MDTPGRNAAGDVVRLVVGEAVRIGGRFNVWRSEDAATGVLCDAVDDVVAEALDGIVFRSVRAEVWVLWGLPAVLRAGGGHAVSQTR